MNWDVATLTDTSRLRGVLVRATIGLCETIGYRSAQLHNLSGAIETAAHQMRLPADHPLFEAVRLLLVRLDEATDTSLREVGSFYELCDQQITKYDEQPEYTTAR